MTKKLGLLIFPVLLLIPYFSAFGAVDPLLMSVNLRADKTAVVASELFNYEVRYKNLGGIAADDVVLKVFLPSEVVLDGVYPLCYLASKNELTFNLGRISENEDGAIKIRVRADDNLKTGKELIAKTFLSFTDPASLFNKKISDSLTIASQKQLGPPMEKNSAAYGFVNTNSNLLLIISFIINLFLAGYLVYNYRKISADKFKE